MTTVDVELADIADKHSGVLEPETVVAVATPVKHPLHRYFEWDDCVAGHEHRLNQARALIRTVKIRREVRPLGEEPKVLTVRKWVAGPDIGASPGGYRLTSQLNQTERTNLMDSLTRALDQLDEKFANLDGYFEVMRKRYGHKS